MLSRTKKRTLALFLAIVMVMGLLPTAALADEFGPETVTTETVVLEPMESAAPEETAQPAQSAAPEETAQPAQSPSPEQPAEVPEEEPAEVPEETSADNAAPLSEEPAQELTEDVVASFAAPKKSNTEDRGTIQVGETIELTGTRSSTLWDTGHEWRVYDTGRDAVKIVDGRYDRTVTLEGVRPGTAVVAHYYWDYLWWSVEYFCVTVERGQPEEPETGTQTVYVYVKPAEDATGGNINAHGYWTVGTIQLDLPQATQDFEGEANSVYDQYQDAVAQALKEINHEYNRWIDLDQVEWYTLHTSDGADNYVSSGTWAWHLDGKIKDIPDLYSVTYYANNGTGASYTDPSEYELNDDVTVLANSFSNGDMVFAGWDINGDGEADYQPDDTFQITGDTSLYAVWEEPKPTTVSFTIHKVDADTGASLAGAVFTVYENKNCTDVYTTVTTDEDGQAVVTLPIGDRYYLKETQAPEDYQILDTKVYQLKTQNNDRDENGILDQIWAFLTGRHGNNGCADFENGVLTVKNEKKSAPVEQGLPVKYYVLNPDRGVPTSGADQGYENYFPSADPEENPQFNYYNGMSGTGLTAETWADLAGGNGRLTIGDELEDTASGVAGTGELDAASRQALDTAFGLSEKYGEYNYEIVWYVVKIQDGKGETGPDANGDAADVHVDGYIKGVPVEVRYHQNYGEEDIYYTHDTVNGESILSGSNYTVLAWDGTGLTTREGYTFLGWSEDPSATTATYAPGSAISPLMSDKDLYAVWQAPENPDPVSVTFEGTKYLDGTRSSVPFTFRLVQTDADGATIATYPEVQNDASGAFAFGPVTFTESGTYTFAVSELISYSDLNGPYTMDTTIYKAVVTVTEAGGTLTADVDWLRQTSSSEDAVVFLPYNGKIMFQNYTKDEPTPPEDPDPVSVTFEGAKYLDGTRSSVPFTFRLVQTDADGATIATYPEVQNDASGAFAFGPVTFTESGTYTFAVSELISYSDLNGPYTMDTTIYEAVVTVTEAGGKLTADVKWENADGPVFYNTTKDDPTPPEEEPSLTISKTFRAETQADLDTVTAPENFSLDIAVDEYYNVGETVVGGLTTRGLLVDGEYVTKSGYLESVSKSDVTGTSADGYSVTYTWTFSLEAGSYRVTENFDQVKDDYKVSTQIDERTGIEYTTVAVDPDHAVNVTLVNTYEKKESGEPSGTPDLSLEKTADKAFVQPGEALTYTLTVRNNGSDYATDVVVTDTLPEGLVYVTSSDGGVYDAETRTVTWPAIDTLGAPGRVSYTVTVTVAEDTQTDTWLKNEAALTSGNTDPEQADHNVYISEIGGPRLTVTKTGPASATVGDQVTYTITVRNDGDIYASNVVVTDVLPEGLTYVSSSGNGTYDAETRTVTWPTVNTLGAPGSVSYTVTVTASQTGELKNVAYADYDENPVEELPSGESTTTVTNNGGSNPGGGGSDDNDDDDDTPSNPGGGDSGDGDVDIDDGDTPLGPNPGGDGSNPGGGSGSGGGSDPGTEIPDDNTPLNPGPDTGIEEGETPLGDLPQTGAVVQSTAAPVNPMTTAGLVALAFSMVGAGLYFTFGRKKGEEED